MNEGLFYNAYKVSNTGMIPAGAYVDESLKEEKTIDSYVRSYFPETWIWASKNAEYDYFF